MVREKEGDLLLDKNYEKLLGLVQLCDENLDNFSVDQARSLHNVDPRCKISEQIRYHQVDELLGERNLDVPETSRKSKVTEKANLRKGMIGKEMNGHKDSAGHLNTKHTEGPSDVRYALKKNMATMEKEDRREKKNLAVMENVKSEPLNFDSCGMNECSSKRLRSEKYNTQVPVKSVVSMDNVKVEAPDSDSGGNHEIRERCSKRPRLEVSNTPKMLESSLVKKKNKSNRTSWSFRKKEKMKINTPNKSSCVLPEKKSGMKKKVNVKAAQAVSSRSNAVFSKRKGSQVLHSSRYRHNPESLSMHMDETYEAFLNLAVVSGDQIIYTPGNGTSHIFEEDMQSSSDSEQTILDNNRLDGYRPTYVKTRAATNKTLRKDMMKRKMSCPKNYHATSSDADLNQQDSHQHEKYRASYVKTKAATNKTLRKRVMKKKMNFPKNYQDTSLNSDLNEQDRHQHDEYRASNVRETYEILKTFEVDGKSIIYKRSNGGRKIYEEVQTTSDAEINAVTNAMHREPLDSFRTMDTDTGHSIKSHNQFREGLMKDLGRPYNQEEYLNLLEDACKRGPSNLETDMFNGMESCQTPIEYGKTYLEVYKDLAEKINAADGDRSRTLNLLRGLFYWLKNMPEEGSFIPWKDKRCLKAFLQPYENRGQPSYKRKALL